MFQVVLTHVHCSVEIVRWVAENKRPFSIVNDRGFQSLIKTGRPEYHIPSSETVSRDVKNVFVCVRKRIAKMLQVFKISFIFPNYIRSLTKFNRSMRVPSVSLLMHGLLPIMRRTSRYLFILKKMGFPPTCCSISWKSLCRIQALISHSHLLKF